MYKSIYKVTFNLDNGKSITFCTDEWNENIIYNRLTQGGNVKVLDIDREFCRLEGGSNDSED